MGFLGFQGVIMAGGKGSRMTELTVKRPKCLLPIGNYPMVWYPIKLFERSGFKDVIIVVLDSVKNEVQASLEGTGLKIHFQIVGIPSGEDWGTADTLRHLYDNNKIKYDVVVVSCDLITDLNLTALLMLFRQHDASMTSLFFQPTLPKTSLPTPGPKCKDKIEQDLVCIDPVTSRLVFLASASDYEETLKFSRGLLKKHGRVCLYSRLLDGHVYAIKKWICQYLKEHNRSMSALKGELVPYTVKKQFTRPLTKLDPEKAASVIITGPKVELIEMAEENELTLKVRGMSSFTDHYGDQSGAYHGDALRCYALNAPVNTFATRVNTLPEYCRINREILERWQELSGGQNLEAVSPSATVSSTQLDEATCLVGDRAIVSERTAVKNSILGPQSSIKVRTRVFNSILMAGASVGEGCAIVNCILCDDAVIGDGCDLKDCLVGSRHIVPSGEKHSNEVLTDEDHLLEIL